MTFIQSRYVEHFHYNWIYYISIRIGILLQLDKKSAKIKLWWKVINGNDKDIEKLELAFKTVLDMKIIYP